MKNKKGSLDVTLYAAVLAILAIIVVALGVVLIREIFTRVTTKVYVVMDAQEIVNPPTTDNPVTATPNNMNLKQGKTDYSLIAFLNTIPDDIECRLSHSVATNSETGIPDILYNDACIPISKDQILVWTVAFFAFEDNEPAITLYSIRAECFEKNSNCGNPLGTFPTDVAIRVVE